MAAIPPPVPPRNPIAHWFQVGGAIFAGFGCMSLMGAVVVIVGINLAMPSDTPPTGTNATGQDAYAVVTAPFRAIRWFINEASATLIFVGLVPFLLGMLFLIVERGVARYRPWSRTAGAALLLVPVLFGALASLGALLDHDYDVAAYTLPLVLVPLYPFWLVLWKWQAAPPNKALQRPQL